MEIYGIIIEALYLLTPRQPKEGQLKRNIIIMEDKKDAEECTGGVCCQEGVGDF